MTGTGDHRKNFLAKFADYVADSGFQLNKKTNEFEKQDRGDVRLIHFAFIGKKPALQVIVNVGLRLGAVKDIFDEWHRASGVSSDYSTISKEVGSLEGVEQMRWQLNDDLDQVVQKVASVIIPAEEAFFQQYSDLATLVKVLETGKVKEWPTILAGRAYLIPAAYLLLGHEEACSETVDKQMALLQQRQDFEVDNYASYVHFIHQRCSGQL